MLFFASAPLKDRHGTQMREPRQGAKPQLNASGEPTGFADQDMRDISHGDIALVALDTNFESDKKECEKEPPKWVKAVMKRETISSKIADALKPGADGSVALKDGEQELLMERLALLVLRPMSVAMIGPVMQALDAAANAEAPEESHAKGNGKTAHAA